MAPTFAAILLAAGKSTRFNDREKKPFADLDGRAVWLRSLEIFAIREDVAQIIIAIAPEDQELFERRYRVNVAFLSNAQVVFGGKERSDSVRAALEAVSKDVDYVAIHDCARACVTAEMVDRVLSAAVTHGAAILAAPLADTLKRGENGAIKETLPRESLWLAQTPQVFRKPLIFDAYARYRPGDAAVTDDAQLVERMGAKVALVESDLSNIKITSKRDLSLASAILKSRPKPKDKAGLHPFGDDQMWR